MVSLNRLQDNLQTISKIGTQDGKGAARLAFSDADWEARMFIIEIMREAGLKIRIDDFGNIIGRREGTNPKAPVVMLGSHIDSVPEGGNFDGIVGVLGAIEVIRCLQEKGIDTYHSIEVVVFMAEESSRFGMATLGSKAFCGKLTFPDIEKMADQQGISLVNAMRTRGLFPERISQSCYCGEIKAFLELHIEQGKVLEFTGKKIGIVTGIAAPTRLRVIVKGQADHSGATPMNMRRDALAAAAEIIILVEKLAQASSQHGIVGTTGVIHANPGVMNVIPGQVELGIDIRGISMECKQHVLQELTFGINQIKLKRDIDAEITVLTNEEPVLLPAAMIKFLHNICSDVTDAFMLLPSGAGHDAMHLASVTYTGMIFIPCRAGISHNPAEWADIGDIATGTELLLNATRKLSEREFTWKREGS